MAKNWDSTPLVRGVLCERLRQLELRSEERDRQGFARQAEPDAEMKAWESEAAWPAE